MVAEKDHKRPFWLAVALTTSAFPARAGKVITANIIAYESAMKHFLNIAYTYLIEK